MRAAVRTSGVIGVALLAAALMTTPAAASSYCSPTGDYCYGAIGSGGTVLLRLDTFSFRGRIRVCVADPRGGRVCHRFRLRSTGEGLYSVRVRWSAHYPRRGPGRYVVTFYAAGFRLRPSVHFQISH